MAEFGSHAKLLKPFQEILESAEAEYRKTPITSWDPIIKGIMEDICKAAAKKKIKIADDDTLQRVSILIFPYYPGPELCLWVVASYQLLSEPLVGFQRRGCSSCQDCKKVDSQACCGPFVTWWDWGGNGNIYCACWRVDKSGFTSWGQVPVSFWYLTGEVCLSC